jgi:hypothetical protein
MTQWGGRGLAKVSRDIFSKTLNQIFVFGMLFRRKKASLKKIKMSRQSHWWGGGSAQLSPNDTWDRGSKIDLISVTYYLNGPYLKITRILKLSIFIVHLTTLQNAKQLSF